MTYYRHKRSDGVKRSIQGYRTRNGRRVPQYRRTMRKDIRNYRKVRSSRSNTKGMKRRIRRSRRKTRI